MKKLLTLLTKNKSIFVRCLSVFFIFLFLPLTGHAKKERVLWESRFDYVALEVESNSVNNEHPIKVSPQFVYQLLASIRLEDADSSWIDLDFLDFTSDDDDEADEYRLFNSSELKKLSPPIAKALSKAKSNEDVIFSITSSHAKVLGKGSLSTSGRMFISEGKFNLILGEFRVDMEQKYRQRGGYSDVSEKIDYNKLKNFRLKTGSRIKKSSIDTTFATTELHFLKPYKNKFRKDWLLIDINAMQSKIAEQQELADRKENIVNETTDIQQQTQQINAEQEELKQKVERMERYLEAKEKQQNDKFLEKTKPAETLQKKGSVEERLSELKSLKDKGYITEDIYQQKMKEILNDL